MYSVVIAFAITWIVVCFTDLIFKSCMLQPYLLLLNKTGTTIKPFYVQFFSTQFNRCIKRWADKWKFMRLWFDIGTIITVMLIVPAMYLLLQSAYSILNSHAKTEEYVEVLQPVVPGLNIPSSQILYYLLSLMLSSVFHELGHALAASREGIFIVGCGFYILFVIPVAFVCIPEEPLSCSSSWQKLRIFTAGAWHNIVLACFALLLLTLNPILLSPLFNYGSGVAVLDVQAPSLASANGLRYGDQIIQLNDCMVRDSDSWKLCLREIAVDPEIGYCASDSTISETSVHYDSPPSECCGNSSSHLCFKFLEDGFKAEDKRFCLHVRKFLNLVETRCKTNADCVLQKCVGMVSEHGEKLFSISRANQPPVLFLGSSSELHQGVSVVPWIPKQGIIGAEWINKYETFLKYLVSFSSALAILNVVPCPGLDGQKLCETLATYFYCLNRPGRKLVVSLFKAFGLVLLVTNIYGWLGKIINIAGSQYLP